MRIPLKDEVTEEEVKVLVVVGRAILANADAKEELLRGVVKDAVPALVASAIQRLRPLAGGNFPAQSWYHCRRCGFKDDRFYAMFCARCGERF